MFLLRIILVVLAAVFVRGLLRRAFAPAPPREGSSPAPEADRAYRDLTDQDISDADFEEIP